MPNLEDLYDDQQVELDRQKEYARKEIGESIQEQCNCLETGSSFDLGLCHQCRLASRLAVLKSAAGYYIGVAEDDGPYCRGSGYYPDHDTAASILRHSW